MKRTRIVNRLRLDEDIDPINNDGGSMVTTKFSPVPDFGSLFVKSEPSRGRPERLGGRAKKLRPEDVERMTHFIGVNSNAPEADLLKLHLSLHAGLRAKEIAMLHLSDVTNPDGTTADFIRIRRTSTKGEIEVDRTIPIAPELKRTIDAFRAKYPELKWFSISHRRNTIRRQSIDATTRYINKLYDRCGLEGCSSHSGRRTFITNLAQHIPPGHSLKDVQLMAGHARLDTTSLYIDAAEGNQAFVREASIRLTTKLSRD